jgi:hypothetical protein
MHLPIVEFVRFVSIQGYLSVFIKCAEDRFKTI